MAAATAAPHWWPGMSTAAAQHGPRASQDAPQPPLGIGVVGFSLRALSSPGCTRATAAREAKCRYLRIICGAAGKQCSLTGLTGSRRVECGLNHPNQILSRKGLAQNWEVRLAGP